MDIDVFGVDDLLDLSNDQPFISATPSTSTTAASTLSTTGSDNNHHHFSCLNYNPTTPATSSNVLYSPTSTTNFTDHLCVPTEDIAELEWLSKFVDDSFTEFPTYSVVGTMNVPADTSLIKSSCRSNTKRSRSVPRSLTGQIQTAKGLGDFPSDDSSNVKDTRTVICHRERSPASSSTEMMPHRCTHCSSEKTPQWRTGPLGPKTLCNACGVRYKSGRLVPEYRPAASPTFVLTQHSNSHRKVMELRRQKELFLQQQQQQQKQQPYGPC